MFAHDGCHAPDESVTRVSGAIPVNLGRPLTNSAEPQSSTSWYFVMLHRVSTGRPIMISRHRQSA